MNTWQRCPICNGSGKIPWTGVGESVCPTCNGRRIISTLNGMPPKPEEEKKP